MFGDLTGGGRTATFEESVLLAGRQSNGVPRGLSCCDLSRLAGTLSGPGPRIHRRVLDHQRGTGQGLARRRRFHEIRVVTDQVIILFTLPLPCATTEAYFVAGVLQHQKRTLEPDLVDEDLSTAGLLRGEPAPRGLAAAGRKTS